jgi:hypothetical protein
VTLEGPADDRGEPTVTLDASGVGGDVLKPALNVAASDFVLRGLRVVGVPPRSGAVRIRAGATEDGAQGPHEVRNVLIEGNIFANDGIETTAYGVTLGMDPSAVDARVEGVLIRSNVFRHYRGDGTVVHLQNHGSRGLIQDVTIQENVFVESEFPVELVNVQGSANRIVGTRVIGNRFQDNEDGTVLLNQGRPGVPPATANQIADTLISGNTFIGNRRWAISFVGGFENADENTITNTRIVNNLIVGGGDGILIRGGDTGGRRNRVRGVQMVNNTAVGLQTATAIHGNVGGAGNTIDDILATNSIFWMNGGDFNGDVNASVVRSSVTRQYGGTNGNISADPRFIDSAQLDFHLAATSPAIDLGEVAGAPAADLECHLRVGAPDLGALEFGASEIVSIERCHAWPTGQRGTFRGGARSLLHFHGSYAGGRRPAHVTVGQSFSIAAAGPTSIIVINASGTKRRHRCAPSPFYRPRLSGFSLGYSGSSRLVKVPIRS